LFSTGELVQLRKERHGDDFGPTYCSSRKEMQLHRDHQQWGHAENREKGTDGGLACLLSRRLRQSIHCPERFPA
ncbi:hypothetical protein PENTCL1PPCAC_24424, partial [Pristionchus entomophagus]